LADDLVERRIAVGRGELTLLQPAESAQLPDDGGVEWAPIAPYWSVLWRSGVALAGAVADAGLDGTRVLELGCGLALPSIAAARAGARALATDADPEALELVDRNAGLNGAQVDTAVVDWVDAGALADSGAVDLVLAADVLYEDASVAPLLELFDALGAEVWLADPGRAPARRLLELARPTWTIASTQAGIVTIYRLRPVDGRSRSPRG